MTYITFYGVIIDNRLSWSIHVSNVCTTISKSMRMVRWICGASLCDRVSSSKLRRAVGVEAIGNVIRRRRLRWYCHVQRKGDTDWVKGCTVMVVEGIAPAGRPKKTCVSEDLRLLGLKTRVAQYRVRWRNEIRLQPNPALSGKTGFKC